MLRILSAYGRAARMRSCALRIFAGGDHFHGLGDLLGVLHRLDLAANLFADRHDGSLGEGLLEREAIALAFVSSSSAPCPSPCRFSSLASRAGVAGLQVLVQAVFEGSTFFTSMSSR
jgi:hypothetical protein